MNIVRKTIKSVMIIISLIIFVGIGQLAQIVASARDLSDAALIEWSRNDNARVAMLLNYKNECLLSKSKDDFTANRLSVEKMYDLESCVKTKGFEEIFEVVNLADRSLQTFAWPLSMIESTLKDNKDNLYPRPTKAEPKSID